MAQACGIPGYAVAIIDHPISSATSEELASKARRVLEQIDVLLRGWPFGARPDQRDTVRPIPSA